MRPPVGVLLPRRGSGAAGKRDGSDPRPRPAVRRRATRRRRAAAAYGAALLIAASLLATRAEADVSGSYQLEFGFAKRALERETAAFCESVSGCVNWRVWPCRRQSWHRVDCLAHLYGETGVTCSFVGIAVWPRWSDQLVIHRKRIVCSNPGGSE